MIRPHPASCSSCPLDKLSTGFIDPEGSCKNGVLIIGEAAGEMEARDSLPFRPYAQAGHILDRCIRKARGEAESRGLLCERSDFGIFNLLSCRPPGNKLEGQSYEAGAINHCNQHLRRVIERFGPRCILGLGNVPARVLAKLGGPKSGISHIRGFAFNTVYGIPVVPSLHPAFIARGKGQFVPVLIRDILYALEVAKHGAPQAERNYIEDPDLDEARAYLDALRNRPGIPIAYDIETDYSMRELDEADVENRGRNIIQVQFSIAPGDALVLPWIGEYIEIAKAIFALANPKWQWNGYSFDEPILEEHGVKIAGQSHDLMWCLRGDSKVKLADGTAKFIQEIVEKQLPLDVLGMDEDNEVISTRIIGWHKQLVKGQTWLKILNDGSRFPLVCTPDHRVWTQIGWKEARDLAIGDKIRLPRTGTDSLIHGSLLGDGHYSSKARSLAVMHGHPQLEYAKAKARHMGATLLDRVNTGRREHYFSSVASFNWRERFYDEFGKQFIPPPDSAALAVWYMDDGNWQRNGPQYRGRVRFPLAGFSNEEDVVEWAEEKFESKDISKHYSSGGYYLIIRQAAVDAFFAEVAPYIHPSMEYKIPEAQRGLYNGWLEKQEPQWAIITEVGAAPVRRGFNNETRYCITVADKTHRFFALGGLVANCWHHLQPDLPRGLQFATSFFAPEMGAWKHLSETQPQFYGGNDVDAVQRIGQRVFADLDRAGINRGYERHILRLRPILKAMCARGFPVDREASRAFRAEIEETRTGLNKEIQALVPKELRPAKPKCGFKANPKSIKNIALEMGVVLNKGRSAELPEAFKRRVEAELGFECQAFDDSGVERFFERRPFLPSSGPQVLAYIRMQGHKVPTKLKEKDADGNAKETTGKEGLVRLYKQTKDELYLKIVDYRELSKIVSTYVDGWKVDDEGRVHSTFLFTPATGQLSSRDPNIQNCVKHGQLAKAFRETIRPKAGHVLIEFDYTAFHGLTYGYYAKDSDYMRLARLDIHSFLTGHLLGLPGRDNWLALSNADLGAQLNEIKLAHKEVRDRKSKPSILGMQFGLGANKLYDMNLESFANKKEAQSVIDLLDRLFPKSKDFRENIKELASKQGYLHSEHGYIRRFHDIYSYRQVKDSYEPDSGETLFVGRNGRRYKRTTGEQGEAAIAFLPACGAFGHIKDCMLAAEEADYMERYRLINQLHDAILMECPVALVDECIANISTIMEAPSMVLVDPDVAPNGLACGIEAMVGRTSWADMQTVYKSDVAKFLREY